MSSRREQKREAALIFTPDEIEALNSNPRPPFRVTAHWLSLMEGTDSHPLRKQAFPSTAENRIEPGERKDPLGEADHSPLPRLIHRYTDRALMVVTGKCALYCRHCFRRRLTGDDFGSISDAELRSIAAWLKEHPEVKELLLSGGDPLTLGDRELLNIIDTVREVRPELVLRLATRMPIVEPGRISTSLARKLGRRRPVWIVIQTNHPGELVSASLKAIERLQCRGLPVVNQAVLLKGVNDSVDILERLSRKLVSAGVKPYYLFQGDVAAGTGHFRLPLQEARNLVDRLRSRLSGLAMPNFAVDLPGGQGKVPLGSDHVTGSADGGWMLRTPDGREGFYPDPLSDEHT